MGHLKKLNRKLKNTFTVKKKIRQRDLEEFKRAYNEICYQYKFMHSARLQMTASRIQARCDVYDISDMPEDNLRKVTGHKSNIILPKGAV